MFSQQKWHLSPVNWSFTCSSACHMLLHKYHWLWTLNARVSMTFLCLKEKKRDAAYGQNDIKWIRTGFKFKVSHSIPVSYCFLTLKFRQYSSCYILMHTCKWDCHHWILILHSAEIPAMASGTVLVELLWMPEKVQHFGKRKTHAMGLLGRREPQLWIDER